MGLAWINGYKVSIDGTRFEISAPNGGHIICHGDCEEGATLRQVYDMHFPRPKDDGKTIENVTLFFIREDICGQCSVHAKSAVLDICVYSLSQEGYCLTYKAPRKKHKSRFEWPDRPRVIAADGFITLPEYVLNKVENRNGRKIITSKFLSHDKIILDAITAYLDSEGFNWREI